MRSTPRRLPTDTQPHQQDPERQLHPAAAGIARAGQPKGIRHDEADRHQASKQLDLRLRVRGKHHADTMAARLRTSWSHHGTRRRVRQFRGPVSGSLIQPPPTAFASKPSYSTRMDGFSHTESDRSRSLLRNAPRCSSVSPGVSPPAATRGDTGDDWLDLGTDLSSANSTRAHWVDAEHQPTDLVVGQRRPGFSGRLVCPFRPRAPLLRNVRTSHTWRAGSTVSAGTTES